MLSSYQNNRSQQAGYEGETKVSGIDSHNSPNAIEVKNQDVLDEYEDGDEVIRL